jgi:hypothetical protein
MPEVSRFYGIVIQIYFADHNPPHFHAFYGGEAVEIDIQRWLLCPVASHRERSEW